MKPARAGTGEQDILGYFVQDVLSFDDRAIRKGKFRADRSVLASEAVRGALIVAVYASGPLGLPASRRMLREHPCLTDAERKRVPVGPTTKGSGANGDP